MATHTPDTVDELRRVRDQLETFHQFVDTLDRDFDEAYDGIRAVQAVVAQQTKLLVGYIAERSREADVLALGDPQELRAAVAELADQVAEIGRTVASLAVRAPPTVREVLVISDDDSASSISSLEPPTPAALSIAPSVEEWTAAPVPCAVID